MQLADVAFPLLFLINTGIFFGLRNLFDFFGVYSL
jgi:hypothetical protein